MSAQSSFSPETLIWQTLVACQQRISAHLVMNDSFDGRLIAVEMLGVYYFVGLVSTRDGSRLLRRDTGVLMNVFLGVTLSVFKRSVACPGHGLLQHVYGVTITCSSWFYIKRDIVKSSLESRVNARKCCGFPRSPSSICSEAIKVHLRLGYRLQSLFRFLPENSMVCRRPGWNKSATALLRAIRSSKLKVVKALRFRV